MFSSVRMLPNKQSKEKEERKLLVHSNEEMIIHLSVFRSCPFAFFHLYTAKRVAVNNKCGYSLLLFFSIPLLFVFFLPSKLYKALLSRQEGKKLNVLFFDPSVGRRVESNGNSRDSFQSIRLIN